MKEKENGKENKKKKQDKKNEPIDEAEVRVNKELEKVAAYQARAAKRMNKQKKIRTVVENDYHSMDKKSNSLFFFEF